jgi:hypothetical protein
VLGCLDPDSTSAMGERACCYGRSVLYSVRTYCDGLGRDCLLASL